MNEITNYDDWIIEDLKSRLAQLTLDNALNMVEIARVACALEIKGVNLVQFKLRAMTYLRWLAKGILIEEAAGLIIDRPMIARQLARLSPQTQRELLDGELVDVVVVVDGGGRTTVTIPILEMESAQIKQVFGDGHIRTVAEQMVWVQNRQREPRKPPKARALYEVRENGVAVNGECFLTWAQIRKMLASRRQSAEAV